MATPLMMLWKVLSTSIVSRTKTSRVMPWINRIISEINLTWTMSREIKWKKKKVLLKLSHPLPKSFSHRFVIFFLKIRFSYHIYNWIESNHSKEFLRWLLWVGIAMVGLIEPPQWTSFDSAELFWKKKLNKLEIGEGFIWKCCSSIHLMVTIATR